MIKYFYRYKDATIEWCSSFKEHSPRFYQEHARQVMFNREIPKRSAAICSYYLVTILEGYLEGGEYSKFNKRVWEF